MLGTNQYIPGMASPELLKFTSTGMDSEQINML